MAKKPSEQVAEAGTEALTKSVPASETIMKENADALTESGAASRAAVQELTRAYQELATKNAKNLEPLAKFIERGEFSLCSRGGAAGAQAGAGLSCVTRSI